MRINTFRGQVSLGTKTGILQINTKTKDGKTMPLGMRRVVATVGRSSNLFSTPRETKLGLHSHIESEAWLGSPDSNIPLRQSYDRYGVYLDSTIALKPSDHLAKLVQRND